MSPASHFLRRIFLVTITLIVERHSAAETPTSVDASNLLNRSTETYARGQYAYPQEASPRADTSLATDNAFDASSPDIGEIVPFKRIAKYQALTVFNSASVLYTNNAALSRADRATDYFLLDEFGFSYQPKLKEAFHFDITVRGALYRYDRNSDLDFNALSVGVGASYTLAPLGLTALARYGFTRLADPGGSLLLDSHSFLLGIQRIFAFSEKRYIFASGFGQLGLADPEEARRNECGLSLGGHIELMPSLSAELNARASYLDYSGSRHDFNESASLALRWDWKWLSVSPTLSFSLNQSNQPVFDYNALISGGTISVAIRF